MRLNDWILRKPNPRKLVIPTGFDLGNVDSEESQQCKCHICWLAGLNGGGLKAAIASFSRLDVGVQAGLNVRRCNKCFGAMNSDQQHLHKCGGKAEILENLKTVLPPETRTQLALETLKELQGAAGDSVIHLQSYKGGKPTVVTIGRQEPRPSTSVLTGDDVKCIQLKNNLTQTQVRNILADYRSLNGRASVEPYVVENMLQSKQELKTYFTSELVNFLTWDPEAGVSK